MPNQDSIIKRLQAALAACPSIGGPVLVDYIRESEPCIGLFPAGEKRLFADWAGSERWQYAFTIQLTGYGLQERERVANEAFAECLSHWAAGLTKNALDLGALGSFEGLWIGEGRLLYPAQDGQTFIYALEGRLLYQRSRPDNQVRSRWFFGFGPADARIWTECAAGIGRLQREAARQRWLYDFDGQRQGREAEAGLLRFSGRLCPADPFQQRALGQQAGEEVLWVLAVCGPTAEALPAKGGLCTIWAQTSWDADPQSDSTAAFGVQLLTEQAGLFWLDESKNGSFLPDRSRVWKEKEVLSNWKDSVNLSNWENAEVLSN